MCPPHLDTDVRDAFSCYDLALSKIKDSAMVDFTNPKDMNDDQIDDRYEEIWRYSVGNLKHDAQASLLATEINRRLVEATTGAKGVRFLFRV